MIPMKFSIIVTTVDRHQEIRKFLQSIEKQTYKNLEIILGDQDSDSSLADYLKKLPFPSTYIPLEPCSLSHARNCLLPAVRGDIVALGDDDCLYQPNLLEKVARVAQQHPATAAFICMPSEDSSRSATARVSPRGLFYAAPSFSLFFNTAWLRKAGDFDESIGIGAQTPWQSGEETDLLLRVHALGGQVLRCFHIARPWHPEADLSRANTFHKAHGYGVGRMYLLKKHGFPFWFKLCNILYPLGLLPVDFIRKGHRYAKLRWVMFTGRVKGFFMTQ